MAKHTIGKLNTEQVTEASTHFLKGPDIILGFAGLMVSIPALKLQLGSSIQQYINEWA